MTHTFIHPFTLLYKYSTKEDESVKIIFYDPDNNTQNGEYIGPSVSSPEKLPYDKYTTGRLHSSRGTRVESSKNITDSDISDNTFVNQLKFL